MSWAKIDDRANENRKLLDAGAEACWLWTCGLMYANRQPARDGRIPGRMLPMLYPFPPARIPKLAAKLVDVGLWKRTDDGFEIQLGEECGLGPDRPHWCTGAYPEVYWRDGRACRYCGAGSDLTVDHVVPRCQGGADSAQNLVVACRRCNGRKGGRTPSEAGMRLLPAPLKGAI